jgi:hypothetical protein
VVSVEQERAALVVEACGRNAEVVAIKLLRRSNGASVETLREQWAVLGQTELFDQMLKRLQERGVVQLASNTVSLNKGKADLLFEASGKDPEVAALRLLRRGQNVPVEQLKDYWKVFGHAQTFESVIQALAERGVVREVNGTIELETANADFLLETKENTASVAVIKLLKSGASLTMPELEARWKALGRPETLE